VKRICPPSNVTLYQNRAAEVEDEHNLLYFLMLHYIDKGKPVNWLAFFNVTQTNLAQSLQSYQVILVAT